MRFVKQAIAAIDRVFSDTSVSQETTLDRLQELKDEIVMKMECIKADLKEKA